MTRSLRQRLDEGLDPDTRIEGPSLLSIATTHHQVDVVKMLVGAGASLDPDPEDNFLIRAVTYGFLDLVQYYVQLGVPVMHGAIEAYAHEHKDVMYWLLDQGFINSQGLFGQTLLMDVIYRSGDITWLMPYNPDVNITTKSGTNALDYAIHCNRKQAFDILLPLTTLSPNDLFHAIRWDREAMVRDLLDAGSDPNQLDQRGNSPLIEAIHRKRISIIKLLLQWGADPNQKNKVGNSPLHFAVHGDPSSVELLLDAGAEPNIRSDQQVTPLAEAARVDMIDLTTMKLLIMAGARTDMKSYIPRTGTWVTPLEIAERFQRPLQTQFLLKLA